MVLNYMLFLLTYLTKYKLEQTSENVPPRGADCCGRWIMEWWCCGRCV